MYKALTILMGAATFLQITRRDMYPWIKNVLLTTVIIFAALVLRIIFYGDFPVHPFVCWGIGILWFLWRLYRERYNGLVF
jgi:DMSO reductase anchor subunit